jgi:hypothetical protein
LVTIGKNYTRTVYGLMYLLFYGQVPRGLELHHKCRNKLCVNPEHLQVVDDAGHVAEHPENSGRHTHCIHGHEYTPENTYVRKDGGRSCRQCNISRVKKWYEKNERKHRERVPSSEKEVVRENVVWDDRIEVPMEEVELDKRDREMYGRRGVRRAKKEEVAEKERPLGEEEKRLLGQIAKIQSRARGVKVEGFE